MIVVVRQRETDVYIFQCRSFAASVTEDQRHVHAAGHGFDLIAFIVFQMKAGQSNVTIARSIGPLFKRLARDDGRDKVVAIFVDDIRRTSHVGGLPPVHENATRTETLDSRNVMADKKYRPALPLRYFLHLPK